MIGDKYISSPLMSYVRCRGSVRQALDVAKSRLIVAGSTLSFLLVCILFRLVDIAALQGDESYAMDTNKKAGLQTERATLVDRNGEIMATTIVTGSLYANAKVIKNAPQVADKLVKILSTSREDLIKRLTSGRRFIWLERHLTPKQQAEIIKLGIPGIDINRDERRIYPHGGMTAHLVGMTDIDNQGISGLEKSLDHEIRTSDEDIRLSVDLKLQNVLFDELGKAMVEFNARAVNGLIMDINTGEVLAMASLPDFNPNVPREVDYKNLFDRNVSGVYELGSILKLVNTALALEESKVSIDKMYDATKPLKIGRFSVTDYHGKNRWMSISDIFRYSSNIGSALMALEAGVDTQKDFLKKIGLLSAANIELPGSAKPIYPRHWSEANAITISYGYGISFNPLQFVASTALLMNNGKPVTPTLLYKSKQNIKEESPIISASTSANLRALMRHTVTQGTAKKAAVKGYVVTGKTGTAMQLVNGKYKNGVLTTSFVGTLGRTLNRPEYVILVTLDQPKGTEKTWGYRGAGWNAAPTAGNIMRRMVSVLGMEPSDAQSTDPDTDIKTLVRLASLEG